MCPPEAPICNPNPGRSKGICSHQKICGGSETVSQGYFTTVESETNNKLLNEVADKFKLDVSPRLIEVYDNSHIQGSNSVGAFITFGQEGFIKKKYRKFNIKNKELNAGDDYGMLKEVFERRFSKIIQNKRIFCSVVYYYQISP